MAKTALLLVFVVLCAACLCGTYQLKLGSPTTIKAIPDWDFLLFVSQWPESFCLFYNASHAHNEHKNEKCIIPSEVKNWTIHGTWPTKFGTEGPTNCNNTWQFDLSKIRDLVPKLNVMWPDFLDENPQFWSHEWDKHGTCAASLPAMYGEHKYFETTLELKERINLYSILSKRGIVPSFTTKYNYDDIIQAIKEGTGGISDIICFQTNGSSGLHQYLAEVRLCLDKSFQPFDCPKQGLGYGNSADYSPCSRKTTIALPPMKYTN